MCIRLHLCDNWLPANSFEEKVRVITLNMVFSKVITFPMVSLTRHEESIKAWFWHTFNIYMIFFKTILFCNLSLTISHCFLFAKKLSKLCFQKFVFCKWKFCRKPVCYLLIPSPSCQKIQRTNRLSILLILPSPSWQKIQRTNRLRILLILPFPLNKRFQRTNRLIYFLFPLHKVSKD